MKNKLTTFYCFVITLLFVGNVFAQNSSLVVEYLPENASGIQQQKLAFAHQEMVSSANRFITQAGLIAISGFSMAFISLLKILSPLPAINTYPPSLQR